MNWQVFVVIMLVLALWGFTIAYSWNDRSTDQGSKSDAEETDAGDPSHLKAAQEQHSEHSNQDAYHAASLDLMAKQVGASERQARAARAAVIVAGLALTISVVGAYFLLSQTEAAWNTASAARQQADAATVPYIFGQFKNPLVLHAWINNKETPDRPYALRPENPFVQLEIKNYGLSPAIITAVHCGAFWGDRDHIDIRLLAYLIAPAADLNPRTVVFKEPIDGSCIPLEPLNGTPTGREWGRDIVATILMHPIWMLASVDFEDVSGIPHTIVVCARYEDGYYSAENDPQAFIPARAPDCTIRR